MQLDRPRCAWATCAAQWQHTFWQVQALDRVASRAPCGRRSAALRRTSRCEHNVLTLGVIVRWLSRHSYLSSRCIIAQCRPHRGRARIVSLWRNRHRTHCELSRKKQLRATLPPPSPHTTSHRSALAVGLAPKCAALMWMTPSESPPPPQGSARDKLHVPMRAIGWISAQH